MSSAPEGLPSDVSSARDRLAFEQMVFSGGGTRCFWHGGFMGVVGPALGRRPERVVGVSGGALSAAAMIADREHELLDVMTDAFERVDSNVELDKIGDDESMTPHQRIYCEVVTRVLDDDTSRRRIAEGPEFHVQIGHPPSERAPRASTIPLFSLYEAEKAIRSTPHLRWRQRAGLRAELVDAREAARDGRLVELVCAAAVIPPIFKIAIWDGRQVIDSGMADKAPMPPHDCGRTLVLLTREFRNLPEVPGRLYVAPSRETPADKIDFTDPAKLRETWALGRCDGESFLGRHGMKAETIN